MDGLFDFVDAIHTAYPDTEVQRCVIHQIRASTSYVSYKDLKAFTVDLKPVYKAPTEEVALAAMDELEAKWGTKYALGCEKLAGKLARAFHYVQISAGNSHLDLYNQRH